MGAFKEFANEKLLKEEEKQVSGNLLKNLIDILHDYIGSEFDLSDDAKTQIINNIKIGLEKQEKGPRFIGTSYYLDGEGEKSPVEIVIDISTEKLGGNGGNKINKPSVEPEPDEEPETTEEEYVEESFNEFKTKKLNS